MSGMGGVGMPSSSATSSATGRTGDIKSTFEGNTIGGGPGGRAFQNFVAFSGSQQDISTSESTGINPPAVKLPTLSNTVLVFGAIAALVFVTILMRR